MSDAAPTAESAAMDLLDRIANALPENLRADYYREMRHLSSLPESDEMLRILRVMQFLTVVTEQVPDRIVSERERLDALFAEASAYHRDLDRRLSQLPSAIAEGISPETIAARINESLRQQFEKSTIPQTAGALSVVAGEAKRVTAELDRAAKDASQALVDTQQATRRMESSVSEAASTARRAAGELARVISQDYKWSALNLGVWTAMAALIVGVAIGWMAHSFIRSEPVQTRVAAPVVATQPVQPPPQSTVRTKHHAVR